MEATLGCWRLAAMAFFCASVCLKQSLRAWSPPQTLEERVLLSTLEFPDIHWIPNLPTRTMIAGSRGSLVFHGHLNDVLFLLTHHVWLLSAEEIPLKFSLGFKAAWIVPWGWTCCTHLNPDVIHFVYNVHKRIFYCKNTPSFCDNSCAGRNIQLNRILARTEHDETLFYRLWYKTVSAHGSSQCLIPNRNVGLLKVQMYSIRQFLFRIWYWRWCIIYITDVVFLLYWRDFGTISMLSS